MFESLSELVQQQADAVWVLPLVAALCALDGFFPPVPSDAAVLALAAIGASAGEPNLVALGVIAAVGAFVGDNIAYTIGRYSGLSRMRVSRRPRMQRGYRWAERELRRRGATVIVAGRYIWVGRVAVNLSAGAMGFPRRRFMALDAVAAVSWAAYTVGLGAMAGSWLEDNPLLAAVVAVVAAVALGVVIDRLLTSREQPGSEPSGG